MKHLFYTLVAVCTLGSIHAQDTLKLTLEEAINRGLAYSYTLRTQQVVIQTTAREADRLDARRAPTVRLNGDLRSNLLLPTTIIPGSAFSNTGQDEADRKIRFGTVFNLGTTLEATYPLVDPTLASDKQIASTRSTLQETIYETQKKSVRLQIAEAWYAVFLQEEQVQLAEQKLQRTQELLSITQTRLDAGISLPADLLRSQLDMGNAAAASEQAQNQLQASRQTLAHHVGLPLNTYLQVSGISKPDIPVLAGFTQPEQRPELLELQQRKILAELEINHIDNQYKPSLNVYGNAAIQHLSNDFSVWQNWFPLAYIGLQAKVTLFDGQLKRKNQEIAQLNAVIAQQNLDQQRDLIAYEIASTETAIRQAVVQWRNAQANLAAGQQLFELDRERYAQGKLQYSELLNTEFTLREAERNALSAWYNYLLARTRWEKAGGL